MLSILGPSRDSVPDSTVVRGRISDPRFAKSYSEQMYRLRYEIFHRRLRWDVSVSDGLEFDQFDDDDSVYMLTTDTGEVVTGGWRLRPSTRRYMLSDIFPQLLHGHPIPRGRHIWEISRFAVDTSEHRRTAGFSLGDAARRLLVDAVQFAIENDISQYVLVVSVAVERLLASSGIVLRRFGPPMRIGRVMSVACWVDIDYRTRHSILGEAMGLAAAA